MWEYSIYKSGAKTVRIEKLVINLAKNKREDYRTN